MTSPSRYDLQVLNNYLRAQAQPALLRDGGLILLAALAWLWLCWQGLSYGLAQRYEFLAKFSTNAQDMALRSGPYVWWALAVLLSLGVLSLLRAWARERINHHWEKIVPPGELAPLCRDLSDDGRAVLDWVWQDRETPLALGDLKRTATELASGRVEKFHIASEQRAALAAAMKPANAQAATTGQPAALFKQQRQEPRLETD
ncbi:hypothetical protein NUK34_03890 [Kerstersia gyiorum]|jgi:hypothetical protein|uniref:hypothetical protein n=1 Tax=Kerstersia gyiorum TaxID=206506 RepID=UPI002150512E|nr:hypothetical protein [Kerstersia gyiorum]MCH4270291.1 hypothetical protein [Kerstersia gyiorum]MCI1230279.1 hypothetical protein [Kerstersia gyiorum]MCR4157996.1 hypothetical protein [Kerstersia gyiorum]